MSCSFKMELWSLRLLYQLQKVHCSRIKDVFTVLPRELSKHRRKTSKEKKKNRVSVIAAGNHEMTEVWTAILGGSDTYYPSSVVCSLHIPRDQRVPTEHCLHTGIYYDHYRPLMCVFGPAPLYCTCRELYSPRSIRGLITL